MVTSKCTSTGRPTVLSHAYFAMKSGTCHGLNSAVSIGGRREAGGGERVGVRKRRPSSVNHREMQLVCAGCFDRLFVTGICMAGHSCCGIVRKNALETHAHFRRAVGDDYLAGME